MKLENYAERNPRQISDSIDAIVQKRLIATIITPVLFQSTDDRILFVGNLRDRLLKLPNQKTDFYEQHNRFDLK
jgi:hypothetical protein